MAAEDQTDITTLTVQLLSAFVSKNSVTSEGLADLIKTTRAALMEDLSGPAPAPVPDHVPAVSIRKSLSSPDHILSLIDGKPYKTLKRHLAANGLTEQAYRARYALPVTYPMVAPSYSETRRAVAQKLGLGKKPVSEKPAAKTAAAKPAAPKASPTDAVKKPDASPKKAQPKPAADAKAASVISNRPHAAAKKSAAAKPKPLKAALSAASAHLKGGKNSPQ